MQTNRITQHYRNRYQVEPICPAHKPRYNGDAEQAEYLRQWTEKRRRRQRLMKEIVAAYRAVRPKEG